MQLIPRYLVTNRVNIVADMAGFVTEYRPVYSRQLKVFKGIDNVIQFRLMNADQKPINTTTYIPKFIAFDENNSLVIEKECTVLDDGSTTTRGLFTVTINESELLNLKQQFLKYNVYLVDANNDNILTYSHSNFDNDASIFVDARTFPGPLATYQVVQFTQTQVDSNEWVSESITAQPAINGNEALHTAAIYTNGYVGNLIIQATLDNDVTITSNWADVATVNFTGLETEPTPVNFNGVFSHLRFKSDADPDLTIEKILVRN